jgi:hypothetical protein
MLNVPSAEVAAQFNVALSTYGPVFPGRLLLSYACTKSQYGWLAMTGWQSMFTALSLDGVE